MNRIFNYVVFGVLAFFLWLVYLPNAQAATVWTPAVGIYTQYKIPPKMINAYVTSTNIEAPAHWVKQQGTFTKFVSAAGAVKYEKIAIVSPPNNPVCEAFVCNDDFGWTFNLSKNTVLTCPMVKVDKGVAQVYDGVQSINGEPKCRP